MIEDNERYLRLGEQAIMIGVHRKTISRWAKEDPTFPPEIRLGAGKHGVRVRRMVDVMAWIASKRKGAK